MKWIQIIPNTRPHGLSWPPELTCRVAGASGEYWAEMSGSLSHQRAGTAGTPVVGDWVVIQPLESSDRAIIHDLLPRQGVIERLQVDQDRSGKIRGHPTGAGFQRGHGPWWPRPWTDRLTRDASNDS